MPTLNASPHRRGPWFLLLALALLVNGGMFLLLEAVLDSQRGGAVVASSGSRVQVSLVPEEKEEPEAKKKRDELQDQIVRNDALAKEKAPKDAKRRSEFDNTVKKETRAPNGRPAASPRKVQPAKQRQASKSAGLPQNRGQAQSPSQPRESQPAPTEAPRPGALVRLDNLGRMAAGKKGRKSAATAPELEGKRGEQGRNLRFSDRRRMAQLFGRPGTMQDLNDVEEGDKTLLNTKRSRYASFFNRVRDAIARHWHPDVLHSAHDPHGKIYGTKDRTTKVIIVLRADGSVLRVKTTGASGVDYLDGEAVRSIWAAQPFSNPPRDLVDPMTGRIEFGFAFTLEFGGRSRIFRMRK